ncbi:hypothetical protein ACSYDW_14925 [Paeniglutamicibacter sp. R2-26]|uniref:hypothetical protein n=1 Tax=Paeniglutamicibacter sp. R2-26 TaxID=3144417 RepID=UPI003EE63942
MKNTGLSLAIAVAAIYAALAGFTFTKMADESTLPGATPVLVTGQTVTTGGQGLPRLVQGLAETTDAAVIREVRDLHSSNVRHLYVAAGHPSQPEARWLADGYPSFGATMKTVVHPVTDLDSIDPRGRYYVLGSPSAAAVVSAAFAELGYATELDTVSDVQAISWFVGGPFASPTQVVMLLIALLVGLSVFAGVKSYAIQRLHGVQKHTAVLRDFRQASPAGLLSILAVVGCGLTGLWFYNGLNQLGGLVTVSTVVFLVCLSLALGVHATAVRLVWGSRLVDGIKGRLGFRVAVPVAYLIRVPGLVLAVSLLAATFAAAGSATEAGQAREDLAAAGEAASIRFESNVPPDEMDRLAFDSGAWLKKEDEAGRTILALPMSLDPNATDAPPDVLLVNKTYLASNVVVDHAGNRVLAPAPGKLKILLPEGSSRTTDDVLTFLGDTSTGEPLTIEALDVDPIQAGQSHFLYEPRPDAHQRPAWVSNIVLVVVDPKTGLIRDDDYMAYASQGRVLMTDSHEAVRNTPTRFLGPWISAYIPVAQSAADEYATQMTELRVKATSMVVALCVLLATAVGLAQIHVRGNAQSILVRHLHGWTFLSTHRWLFAAESILLAVVACWATARVTSILALYRSGAGPGIARGTDLAIYTWQPWAVLLVAFLNFGLLFGLVHVRTRLMIRTQSEETA